MIVNCCVLFHPFDAFIVAFLKRQTQIDAGLTFFIPDFPAPGDLINNQNPPEITVID